MEYRILGPLAVICDGNELALGGLRQRAVLAVLLLAGERAVDADRLIEQVWGDHAPSKPLASLRSYITNLRRILGDGAVIREGGGYRIDSSGATVDAHEFARAVAHGSALLEAGEPAAAKNALAAALSRWRGTPLADFGDHHFAIPEIHRLDAIRLDAVECYYNASLRLGEHETLVAGLQSEVGRHPLREKFWWQLMLAMYRSGRRTEALKAYEDVSQLLDTELGVAPGSALERLVTDIRNESAALDWEPPAPPPGTPGRRFGGLFGRAAEVRRLTASLTSAVGGHGGVVVVSGDSGMGKTVLAQHVAQLADQLGMATVWAGHAAEVHRPPSWAWAHALRELAGQLPTGASGHLHATLPDWWTVATEDASAGETLPANRFDALQATAAALSELVAKRPALIVVDDLQRADRFTVDVLEYIAAAGKLLPLLIVATWQEDAADSPLGQRVFDRLRSRTDIEFVKLRGLSLGDAEALIADLSGATPRPEFAAGVHARTGGNPFFIRELVHLMMDDGRVGSELRVGDDVPEAVSGVIRRRLSLLPQSSRTVLDVAAVLGSEFPAARLASALEMTTAATIEALEPAIRIGLLVETRVHPTSLRFSHGLVRDAVAAEITGNDRARLHADIAESFARQRGDVAAQDAIDGADHAWQAGAELDPASALELLDRARADAWSRSAYREVAELDRRALVVCSRLPADSQRFDREVDLQLQLASVEAVVNGQSSANVLASMKNSSGGGHESVQSTAAVAMGCLEACGTGRYHDATVLSDSLVEFFDITADPIAGAAGYYIRALADFMRGNLEVAAQSVRTLHATVPPVDRATFGALASFEVLAYGVAAHAAGLRGELDDAQAILADGIAIGTRAEDAFGCAVLRTAGIQLAAMLGIAEDLYDRADSVVAELTELGIDQFIGGAKLIRGWARAMETGGVDTVDEMHAAMELHSRGGRRIFSPLYLGLLADATAAHRDLSSAQALLARADSVAAATGERVWNAQLSARRLRLLARARSTSRR